MPYGQTVSYSFVCVWKGGGVSKPTCLNRSAIVQICVGGFPRHLILKTPVFLVHDQYSLLLESGAWKCKLPKSWDLM